VRNPKASGPSSIVIEYSDVYYVFKFPGTCNISSFEYTITLSLLAILCQANLSFEFIHPLK